jgi:hypothetical protein
MLAANADEQRAWLSGLGVPGVESSADELALEFNDGFRLATQWVDAGWLPAALVEPMAQLDRLLESMSGPENEPLWQTHALDSSQECAAARAIGAKILREL